MHMESMTAADKRDLGPKSQKPTATYGTPQEASWEIWVSADRSLQFGIWECTQGSFSASREGFDEVCYILSGKARVTEVSSAENSVLISAGDTLVTPAGWSGNWDILEPLKKVYVIRVHQSSE